MKKRPLAKGTQVYSLVALLEGFMPKSAESKGTETSLKPKA